MRMFHKLLHDNKGLALPMALVMLVMVGMMVVPVVSLINTNLVSNEISKQAIKKYYSVDTAINFALWKMKYDTSDTTFQNWIKNSTVNQSYNLTLPEAINDISPMAVTVENRGPDQTGADVFKISAEASNDILQYDDQVRAFVSIPSTTSAKAHVAITSGASSSSVFKYALATLGGDLTMTGSVSIGCVPMPPAVECHDGDVWINGDLNMGWSTSINGKATITGEVNSPNPNPNIYGGVVQDVAPPRPTWLDDKAVDYVNSTAVTLPSFGGTCGNWTDLAGVYNNPICVNGDMNLTKGGTYRFKDTVYVKGNLKISSGTNQVIFEKSVRVDGYVYIDGSGTVTFENSGNYILSIGKYLRCEGSRPATFGGKVSVEGAALYSKSGTYYAVYFDGTGDVVFSDTLRSMGNARFGSSRTYNFYAVIYCSGNILFDGSSETESLQIEAIVADGSITVTGSAQFISDPEVAPFLISRKIGCCTTDTICNGITLSGSSPVTAIVYAPDSRAWVAGSSSFSGAMVAKCAQLDGSATLKYPVVLDTREDIENPTEGGTISVTSYFYD